MSEFASYVKEQCPDVEVEFISGNNNVFLYDYLEKHGELPDIITTRRFSSVDAKNLCSYLLDLSAFDVVSEFYPYALQNYIECFGGVHWLPVCGIPEIMKETRVTNIVHNLCYFRYMDSSQVEP